MNHLAFWLFGVRILRLRSDDVLVIHCEQVLTDSGRERLHRQVESIGEKFGFKTRAIILEEGLGLSVVRQDPDEFPRALARMAPGRGT